MYHITAKIAIFSTDMPLERCLEFNVLKEYRSFGQYQEKQVSLATAKLAIFLQNMLWESCSKFNLQQLPHSMFCKDIASLAVHGTPEPRLGQKYQGNRVSIASSESVIFGNPLPKIS